MATSPPQHSLGASPSDETAPSHESDEPKRTGVRRIPLRRRWLYRGLLLALLLLPLLLCEALLALLGWGTAAEDEDPYIAFSAVQPLFVRVGDRYEIPESRQVYFRPQAFPATKGPRTFRIVCFGGSTVQGSPYSTETAFSTWLALNLKAADSSRDWEVINCGGISYASYRLAPIVEEMLGHEPDLLILYIGHNEFLEDRTYGDVKATPAAIAGAHAVLSRSRTYSMLRSAWMSAMQSAPAKKTELPDEVDTILDYQRGLDEYHRDDAWRAGVVRHFEFNLRRMIGQAREAGVPVLLVDPPCNLKDCPPFKFEPSPQLDEAANARVAALWNEAQRLESEQLERQCALLREALAVDGRHAGIHYHLAKCLEGLGRFEEAKRHFLRACDDDVCPLRVIEPLHAAIRRTASDTGTPLVDLRKLFDEQSPEGIPGDEMFVDHVHPHIHWHQRIADELLEAMAREALTTPVTDWRERRKPLYVQQMGSLDEVYFERAKQRLDGQNRWAQGRALKIRPNADRQLLEPPGP
jgi:lysophospholipase L1-like esterase